MRKKYTVIAPVGDNLQALFVGIRDFATKKVILLTPANLKRDAERAAKQLEQFEIPVNIVDITGNVWEEMFGKIAQIRKANPSDDLLVNAATGDRTTTCAATCAAFVNGIKAMSVERGESMLLPILKFSYYKILSDKKMKIILALEKDKTCCDSLESLAKKTGMSLPLISYHVNGNLKSEGLIELGLVETSENSGRIAIRLTMLGHLLAKGYVSA
ncbi:ArsR family transcriptional regulator [Candidatus Woesearchaeota archaeon]|nr:MAG: ArsR family transcriptional regulator [Candidatus Woesearchaeota archaeon]